MKIVFCLKHFLPSQVAGTEVYVKRLALSLLAMGHNVIVVKPNYGNTGFSSYEYKTITVLEYPESAYNDKALKIGTKAPSGLVNFLKIIEEHRPDVVHFHEISGSNGITIFHLKGVQALGIKIFTTLHLLRYVCKTSTLRYMQTEACDGKIIINKCAACILEYGGLNASLAKLGAQISSGFNKLGYDLSEESNRLAGLLSYTNYVKVHKKQFESIFAVSNQVIVLNNWFKNILLLNEIDAGKISLITRPKPEFENISLDEPVSKAGDIRLVYIGRICKIKGLLLVLSAMKEMKLPNLYLDIYGNVTEQDYYQQCLDMCKGQKNINWCGVVEQEVVVTTLAQYDVLVFPSIVQEMSPFVTDEAFAAGLPVLASDILEAREVIQENENGWIFKLNDVEDLKRKLKRIANGQLPILKRTDSNSDELLDFDRIASAHLEVYNNF